MYRPLFMLFVLGMSLPSQAATIQTYAGTTIAQAGDPYAPGYQQWALNLNSGDAVAQRDAFLADVGGPVGLEDFESFANGTVVTNAPLALNFTNGIIATVKDTMYDVSHAYDSTIREASYADDQYYPGYAFPGNSTAQTYGRFNTTPNGVNFLSSGGGSNNEPMAIFEFNFATALSAFGFFLTDLFDQGSDTYVQINGGSPIYLAGAAGVTVLDPPNVDPEYNANTGSLTFFGIRTDTPDITTITIIRTNTQVLGAPSTDVLGLDDFYAIAGPRVPPPVVPEPSTLALAGLALAGIPLRFRRRKAA